MASSPREEEETEDMDTTGPSASSEEVGVGPTPAEVGLKRIVQLRGLKATTELNGKLGFLIGRKANGRVVVRLVSGGQVAVSAVNFGDIELGAPLPAKLPDSDHAPRGVCPCCRRSDQRLYEAACCGGASCVECLRRDPRCGRCGLVGQTRWADLTAAEWRLKVESGNAAAAYVLGERWLDVSKDDARSVLRLAAALGHRRALCLLVPLLFIKSPPTARSLLFLLDQDGESSAETKAAAHAHAGNYFLRRACPDLAEEQGVGSFGTTTTSTTGQDDDDEVLTAEMHLREAEAEFRKAGGGVDKAVFLRGWRDARPAFHWIIVTCSLGESLVVRANKATTERRKDDAAKLFQLALDFFLQAKTLADGFAAMAPADFDLDDQIPDAWDMLHSKLIWFQEAVLKHLFHAALDLDALLGGDNITVSPKFLGIIQVAREGRRDGIL